jgi:hypothetical protein
VQAVLAAPGQPLGPVWSLGSALLTKLVLQKGAVLLRVVPRAMGPRQSTRR